MGATARSAAAFGVGREVHCPGEGRLTEEEDEAGDATSKPRADRGNGLATVARVHAVDRRPDKSLKFLGSGAAGGDRTHDPWLRRPKIVPYSKPFL